jgi:CheY-like chemotaxis protein
MADDALASQAAGADGHLTKPIGAEKLIRAIHDARRPRAGAALAPDDPVAAVAKAG